MGALISLTTNYSEAGGRHYKKKKKKKVKKYSKAWWKQYRAKQRRQKYLAARKRALRLRQLRLARLKQGKNADQMTVAVRNDAEKSVRKAELRDEPILPSGERAPKGWKRSQTSAGELQFRVDDESGRTIGTASLSVVGPAAGPDRNIGNGKTLGGVQTSALRRTVIDQMMREQGWVVNDYQKEVGGKKVYVVVAQSPGAGGRVQSRLFYFAESDGRIYSLATNAPDDAMERIAQESEKVIYSLHRTARSVQQAELR